MHSPCENEIARSVLHSGLEPDTDLANERHLGVDHLVDGDRAPPSQDEFEQKFTAEFPKMLDRSCHP